MLPPHHHPLQQESLRKSQSAGLLVAVGGWVHGQNMNLFPDLTSNCKKLKAKYI